MPAAHRVRHLSAWIAIVAMLAFALVPTLARALAFAAGGWVEICTPLGIQQVAANGAGDEPAQVSLQRNHCAFCGLATDAAAPLPARTARSLQLLGSAEPPDRLPRAGCMLRTWSDAQARGPPLLG